MSNAQLVVKLSGHQIDDPDFLSDFAHTIADLQQPTIIVHGGGKEISALQERLGITPQYIDGVRITDAESLAIVTMVLCGTINKRLVQALLHVGVDAQGLSGIDRRLIQANKMSHPEQDMGFTGEVIAVAGEVLLAMCQQGITPVIAPISWGADSHYNVNADHVAGAVAESVKAERLVFLSNVEGVMVDDVVIPHLSATQTRALITEGTIFGGMIPKVQTALQALNAGVESAVITNLDGLRTHGGTRFTLLAEPSV
ncbi:MAG: acetylglutamate kinase [Anaerolineae bacterium]